MKKAAAFLFAILIFLASLPSCTEQKAPPSCRELISVLAEAEVGIPAGRFYSMDAPSGDGEYLSDSLLSALFGGGSYPKVAEGWLDCAFFLSLGDDPRELAVILCRDRDVAHDTATALSARLSAIKLTKTDPQYEMMLQNASVTLVGNYALLFISSDCKTALKVFLKNK